MRIVFADTVDSSREGHTRKIVFFFCLARDFFRYSIDGKINRREPSRSRPNQQLLHLWPPLLEQNKNKTILGQKCKRRFELDAGCMETTTNCAAVQVETRSAGSTLGETTLLAEAR